MGDLDRVEGEVARPVALRAMLSLVWAERVVFFTIGLMLFLAAIALLKESATVLLDMFTGGTSTSATSVGSEFLDVILLVLMIVELAYTVLLSLRGAVLSAEPFLIVGLIAVIRRILVITVGEVNSHDSIMHDVAELGILSAIVVVFVGSIVALRFTPTHGDNVRDDNAR